MRYDDLPKSDNIDDRRGSACIVIRACHSRVSNSEPKSIADKKIATIYGQCRIDRGDNIGADPWIGIETLPLSNYRFA